MPRSASMAGLVAAGTRRPGKGWLEHTARLRGTTAQADPEQPGGDRGRARSRRHRVHQRRCAHRAAEEETAIVAQAEQQAIDRLSFAARAGGASASFLEPSK